MYLFYFYVPEANLQVTKAAVFAAGAGRIGDYQECCWQTKGQGQYKPLDGSDPHIGQHNVLSEVVEYKVEMVCPAELKEAVEQALLDSHPYEEVAYGFLAMQE